MLKTMYIHPIVEKPRPGTIRGQLGDNPGTKIQSWGQVGTHVIRYSVPHRDQAQVAYARDHSTAISQCRPKSYTSIQHRGD